MTTTPLRPLLFCRLASPLGPLHLECEAEGDAAGALTRLAFGEAEPSAGAREDAGPFAPWREQLDGYWARERLAFDLPLAPTGTDFQRRVWAALGDIPFGRTSSYGALAERLGGATLTRAVGRANGQNPIAIVVPCHRVIGANGDLVGYAGGLPLKRALLVHERVLLC